MRNKKDPIVVFADFLDCPVEKIQFLFDIYQTIYDTEKDLKSPQPKREKQNEKHLIKTLECIDDALVTLKSQERGWLTEKEWLECHVYIRNKIANKPAYQRMIARKQLDKAVRDRTGSTYGRTVMNWANENDIAAKTLIYGLVSYAMYYRDSKKKKSFKEVADVLDGTGVLPITYDEVRSRYDNVIGSLSYRIFVHNCLRELRQTIKILAVNGEESLSEITYALPIWDAIASPEPDPLFVMVRTTMTVDFSITL